MKMKHSEWLNLGIAVVGWKHRFCLFMKINGEEGAS